MFKPELLPELKAGCFVNGAARGLGENRKTGNGLEIEPTFRMLRILKQGGVLGRFG